ncbi:MAG TPA: DUF72 domain-containing protein, partial [Candidatus Hydrogenedentes bacterium]|nr:DUF72 domain-containing protein [Candidatus Hydrogenedentota bacterium]
MSMFGPLLRLGTSSLTAKGWEQAFYSPGARPAEYLREYSRRYNTVEIDATFYGMPRRDTVKRWRDETPDDFVFAAKTPQTITHDRLLENCEADMAAFLDTLRLLENKLGPVLLQFPYFAKARGVDLPMFLDRLGPFLDTLPQDGPQFAVEVRNKTWLRPPLFDLLRSHGVALALIDHPWMPRPGALFAQAAPVTADFTYIRWLGDRKGIEQLTTVWRETIVDRARDIEEWLPPIKALLERKVRV